MHFDTEDARLARSGVSLVRREAGEDAGWHLVVPTGAGVRRVGAAPTPSAVVPVRLRRLVTGLTRDAELVALPGPPVATPGRVSGLRRPKRARPARLLVHARLAEQVDELLLSDCDVRLGLPDGVHRFRVACRRLRAATGTFADLLDPGTIAPIRAELQWVARAVGPARDAEVARDRLRVLVSDADLVGPVRRRLDTSYRALIRDARAEAEATLSSPRYLALLAALEQLVAAPRWTDAAELPAKRLGPHVDADWRRLRRRVRRLEEARKAGEAVDQRYHDVRRSAKRLRYAAETLEPVLGGRARDLVKRSRDLTRLLGDLQDSVIVRSHLVAIAASATSSGENAFTYGRLDRSEELHAEHLRGEFGRTWRRLEKCAARADLEEP